MFIWAGLAFASFFIGLFVYPWHNVPNNYAEIEQKGIDTVTRNEFIKFNQFDESFEIIESKTEFMKSW